MSERSERTRLSILRVLNELSGPAGAARITSRLSALGIALQPRSVRFHLQGLDKAGLTRCVSRRLGREITERGRAELSHANVMEKVGFIAARVDVLGYRMSYELMTDRGTIIANMGVIKQRDFSRAVLRMRPVFARGLGMGQRVALGMGGETLAGFGVPSGSIALGTICSVTLNGVMLRAGIPVQSRFGGLVEMRDGRPVRFVELMEYSGTTVDPLEVFITAGRTSVLQCAESGSGIIGASFREVPSPALEEIGRLRRAMAARGLGGILTVGKPNCPLLDVPVAEGRTGILVIGGLNPIAALHEAGIPVAIQPLSGLAPIAAFVRFEEIALKGRRRSPYVD